MNYDNLHAVLFWIDRRWYDCSLVGFFQLRFLFFLASFEWSRLSSAGRSSFIEPHESDRDRVSGVGQKTKALTCLRDIFFLAKATVAASIDPRQLLLCYIMMTRGQIIIGCFFERILLCFGSNPLACARDIQMRGAWIQRLSKPRGLIVLKRSIWALFYLDHVVVVVVLVMNTEWPWEVDIRGVVISNLILGRAYLHQAEQSKQVILSGLACLAQPQNCQIGIKRAPRVYL